MNYEPFIVASALRDPVACVIDQGGDARGLMADACLPPAAPHAADAADGAVPLSRFVAFSQLAAARLGRRDFGWRAGMRFDPENLGEVGRAALRAPTLGCALTLLRDAFCAVQGASQLRLWVNEGEAALSYRILDPDIWPREQDAALTLAVLAQLIGRAAGGPGALSHVAFEQGSARVGRGPLAGVDCPVSYDAPCNALFFPARLLDRRMPRCDAAAWPMLAADARSGSRIAAARDPLPHRVRREMQVRLGFGDVDQTSVAAALGLSRRTLRRRLEEDGATFSDLLAETRERAARRLLADPSLSLAEIAERLSYADQSAFERAFRKRVGVTPARFRKGG